MSYILSGAWLYKRKKEPEPIKEEEVIDLVQQAMDNPSANTTVKSKYSDARTSRKKDNTVQTTDPESYTQPSEISIKDDPKVVDLFKDFPEPYRKKAIERYSDRSGWYRFDAIRDFMMEREHHAAMTRGIFFEDMRDMEQQKEDATQKQLDQKLAELEEKQKERVAPEWEKQLSAYIPLSEDESLSWKLISAANLAALSALLFYHGVKGIRAPPKIERWRAYAQTAVRFGASGVAGTGAVCRVMDWGPFDRSEDKRDMFTKLLDDTKEDLNRLIDYFEGKSK